MRELTKARRAWLERVAVEGPVMWHGRGTTAFYTRKEGLTIWVSRLADGSLFRGIPPHPTEFEIVGEELTPAGRAALNEARDEH